MAPISGQIVRFFGFGGTVSFFEVNMNLTSGAFNGGTIDVAGETFKVMRNSRRGVYLTVARARLPFLLIDDDPPLLLSKAPDVTELANAMAEAYILPVFDVGNSSTNVAPLLNVGSSNASNIAAQEWNSVNLNTADFWVAYVLNAFQPTFLNDGDPNAETRIFGETPSGNEGGSSIYREAILDKYRFGTPDFAEGMPNATLKEQATVLHEIGHAVGKSDTHPVIRFGPPPRYTPSYIHLMRRITKPDSR